MVKFEIRKSSRGLFYWRLIAGNNRIVCWSEEYDSEQGAINSVAWVRSNALKAPVA